MGWRKSREYREWRVAVIKEHKKCAVCGSMDKRHAHHLNHATYHKSERFDVNNGICLCAKCHSHYHNDYHRSFRENCTQYDFTNFLSLVDYIRGLA